MLYSFVLSTNAEHDTLYVKWVNGGQPRVFLVLICTKSFTIQVHIKKIVLIMQKTLLSTFGTTGVAPPAYTVLAKNRKLDN